MYDRRYKSIKSSGCISTTIAQILLRYQMEGGGQLYYVQDGEGRGDEESLKAKKKEVHVSGATNKGPNKVQVKAEYKEEDDIQTGAKEHGLDNVLDEQLIRESMWEKSPRKEGQEDK